ncbi:hypothetical protein TGAM01_v206659 [Trichoderma gamsii]|uniref:Uncharacterized protein n=1 Tax=Trichoderma gamsii TaxID=398673 RepID=A0A2P4ZJ57_9HYPO|nr:hypothetical protein TGAM01_v206659 [Trichoderma gamsii]PON24327.1 hypothetical protein TGAM01_v206659 [Trichoderma gamsii]
MEMKFVDVTERTTQGARSGKKKLKDTSERTLSHSYSSSTSSSSSSSSMPALTNAVLRRKQQQQQQQQEELLPFPTFNFSIPPESVAQVFFFRHYSITGSIRHYEMQKNSAMSALKMMGIVAVGMAGLAISKQDPGVMALARRKYGSTLLSINEAIKTREEAMGSIIKRMPAAHIRQIVQTSPLFNADDELEPAARLFDIICDLAELHSASNEADEVNHIAEKISAAMTIEKELLAWKSDLPERWMYSSGENKLDKAYGPSCHVYACPWQSYIWNHYRICRRMTHSVLLHYLGTLALPVTQVHPALIDACASQREASHKIQAAKMRDLRASMPYILDFYDKSKGNSRLFPQHSGVFGLLASIQAMIGVEGVCKEDAKWLCQDFFL